MTKRGKIPYQGVINRLMTSNNTILKKSSLRNNEYYDIQVDFDSLYKKSGQNYIFHKLYELIVDERNIKLAYRNIKNNDGSYTAGVNGTTIENWANKDVNYFVNYIKNRLNNYQPSMVRRVEIPKSDGKVRPLGIPTIEDRLIQQCIKQVLEPICEAKFNSNSYGFRPNRSTEHAIASFVRHVNRANLYFIVDIDIKSFFDNVNHGKLLKQLWTMGIQDKRVISIISKMLKAEIKGIGLPVMGTPQGGILSPLLSNIVLNELDWWISNQWETFETKHDYTTSKEKLSQKRDNGHKYRALRNTKMKEIYIVRYADDFKLICRNKDDAKRIFEATKMWLKERLGLEINEEKSKIVDIRKSSSEFLGFRFKAKKKRNKFVVQSNMTDKAIKHCEENLIKQINKMSKKQNVKTVMNYNAIVMGMQNYYSKATNVSVDMRKIAYRVNKKIKTRLTKFMTKHGYKSLAYKRTYKGNCKEINIAEITLYPIASISTSPPYLFNQKICDYTKEGRELIHKNASNMNPSILKYLLRNPSINRSVQFNDNRLSLYVGQGGKCAITGDVLEIGNMHVHHIIPMAQKGSDEYKNLVFVTHDSHTLLHVRNDDIIAEYMNLVKPDNTTLKKINKFRLLVGNSEIKKKI